MDTHERHGNHIVCSYRSSCNVHLQLARHLSDCIIVAPTAAQFPCLIHFSGHFDTTCTPFKMSETSAVDELLTLLDTIGSNESDSISATSFDLESSHAAAQKASRELPLRDTLKTKKDRRRKEGPVMYTTSLQRRKKAELEHLREEAQQLNDQLEELQRSRLGRIGLLPTQEKNISAWRGLAMIESEGRERAERTNRKLKLIMANQMAVRSSFQKLLGRKNAFEVSVSCELAGVRRYAESAFHFSIAPCRGWISFSSRSPQLMARLPRLTSVMPFWPNCQITWHGCV
jgi:hypothetical protein